MRSVSTSPIDRPLRGYDLQGTFLYRLYHKQLPELSTVLISFLFASDLLCMTVRASFLFAFLSTVSSLSSFVCVNRLLAFMSIFFCQQFVMLFEFDRQLMVMNSTCEEILQTCWLQCQLNCSKEVVGKFSKYVSGQLWRAEAMMLINAILTM